jgi:hypothetical protein
MKRSRIAWVVVIALVATLVAAIAVVRGVGRGRSAGHLESGVIVDEARLAATLLEPHALFRSTKLGEGYGHVVAAALAAPEVRVRSTLECDRVDAVANAGVCLTADRGVLTKYWAITFDGDLQPHRRIELSGIPSRVRISADGRVAGITVFVSGHGYAATEFSTRTTLMDVANGTVMADLEDFAVTRAGQPFKQVDFNFWGVTFTADANTFYATLGSGNRRYLVMGDAARRTASVVAEGIECPALSPDHQRIAYKHRVREGGRLIWRLAVLELSTMATHVIEGERRSVDDQVEWLDDRHIVYALPDEGSGNGGTSIWKADILTGVASLWAEGAYSPSIVSEHQRRDDVALNLVGPRIQLAAE